MHPGCAGWIPGARERPAFSPLALRCSPMATVPQRELRNNTAALLRRVAAGETVRITSNGLPVADLVPVDRPRTFVALGDVVAGIGGLLAADDGLAEEIRAVDTAPSDPFA